MSVLAFLALTAGQAHANPVCGATLTANTTLTGDLDCSGYVATTHLLTIATDGVSFNGAGYTITGATGTTTRAIYVNTADNVTVQNVTIEGLTAANAAGVYLRNTDGASVASVTATGLPYGINTGSVNTALTLINNNVSNSTRWGMRLLRTGPLLDMTSNTFDGSAEGLRLVDTVGGSLQGTGNNTFVGVASVSAGQAAVFLDSVTDFTVNGVNVSGSNGRGIEVTSSTGVTLTNNNASGRYRGIFANGANNTDFEITGNDLSNSSHFGLHMSSLQLPLSIENNTLDGSVNGIYLNSLTGPWTFPTTNTFDDVPVSGNSTYAIDLENATDVTIANLDLSASVSGVGRAIRLNDTDGVIIDNVIAIGHNIGLITTTATTDLVITDSDFSASTARGMQLNNLIGSVTLDDILLDNSANGMRVQDTYGPLTLNVGDVSFLGTAVTGNRYALRVQESADLTVQNLFADSLTTGRAVQFDMVDDSTIQGITVCGALRGIDLIDSFNVSLVSNGIGESTNALVIDAATDLTTGALQVLGNTNDISDSGTNTSVTFPVLPDADMNGIADICDTCPLDPFNDLDNDGLCGDVDDDDDGDGVLDINDLDPNNNEVCGDSDGDTCDDCSVADTFAPNNDGLDTDASGLTPDGLCDAGDPDDDNDTILDGDDSAPLENTSCRDDDLDGCDDCTSTTYDPANDGVDADTDGVCDPKDLSIDASVSFTTASVSWSTGGVGSPSVVYDPSSSLFVMVYETQVGTHSDCPVGIWAIGLATSPDGLTWTDAGGPLVQPVPESGTYYECVAAHPNIVDRFSGALRVFFKTEQGDTPATSPTPSWGSAQYTGVGRLVLSWNGTSYGASLPDANPVLSIGANFGYPRAVFSGGQYKMALTQKPNMVIATGPASGLALGGTVWSPGDAPWTPDEVYNPAVVCEADGSFAAFVGGRELDVSETVLTGTVGRIASTNFTTWNVGPGPIFNTSAADVEMRHFDVLRVGTANYLMYFDSQTAGVNSIGLAQTAPGWSSSSVQSKVCP